MEEDLTIYAAAEKKSSKTTRVLEERLTGVQNELKAVNKLAELMQDFLDVRVNET